MSTVPDGRPVQVLARVVARREVGAYVHLTLLAPSVAAAARPGHFVALSVGGSESALLLRRSFSLHRASAAEGTVEVVVADAGPGTRWICGRQVGDEVDVVGPVGQPFPVGAAAACTLVGGGYGSAPMFWLAEALRHNGSRVDMVLGAATVDRLFGVDEARDVAESVAVTTDDGSVGVTGRVTDVLPEVLARSRADVVYACGPMGMLRAVTDAAALHGVLAYVAVEESMACGIGVCMTCVLPAVADDGRTRMVRSCVEGPVFRGDRVRWDALADGLGAVPEDAVGAPSAPPARVIGALPGSDGASTGGGT